MYVHDIYQRRIMFICVCVCGDFIRQYYNLPMQEIEET